MAVAVARHSIFRNFLGHAASRRQLATCVVALPRRSAVLSRSSRPSSRLDLAVDLQPHRAHVAAMPDGDLPPWRNPQPLIERRALRGKTVEPPRTDPALSSSRSCRSSARRPRARRSGSCRATAPPRASSSCSPTKVGRQLFVYAGSRLRVCGVATLQAAAPSRARARLHRARRSATCSSTCCARLRRPPTATPPPRPAPRRRCCACCARCRAWWRRRRRGAAPRAAARRRRLPFGAPTEGTRRGRAMCGTCSTASASTASSRCGSCCSRGRCFVANTRPPRRELEALTIAPPAASRPGSTCR